MLSLDKRLLMERVVWNDCCALLFSTSDALSVANLEPRVRPLYEHC